ncbi:MAG TPA: hypothetical protein P5274_03285 [Candidatus Paceibacterota bacterium]|nr:hypothetical protein [Candidatus Paceibacterota bacterium]
MKNFNQGGGSRFGGGSRGGSRFGGGNRSGGSRFGSDRGPVTMHKAVCSDCGNDCEVPFRPTGDKPIFCSDCFSAKRGGEAPRAPRGGSFGGDRGPRKDFAPRGDNEVKKQLEFLGMKIDRLTKIVEGLVSAPSQVTAEKSAGVKEAIRKATDKEVAEKTDKKVKTPTKKVAKKKISKKTAY